MFSTSSPTPPAFPSDFKETYDSSTSVIDHVETEIKQPRYAFHTRSQVDMLDDGYQWRKYGKKIVKNNKFPRCYYRCSHKGCNVRKQIQRHSEDEQIVVTTYEGTHTHPVQNSSDSSFEQILGNLLISNLLLSLPPN